MHEWGGEGAVLRHLGRNKINPLRELNAYLEAELEGVECEVLPMEEGITRAETAGVTHVGGSGG